MRTPESPSKNNLAKLKFNDESLCSSAAAVSQKPEKFFNDPVSLVLCPAPWLALEHFLIISCISTAAVQYELCITTSCIYTCSILVVYLVASRMV
jgi:hypothetical protein